MFENYEPHELCTIFPRADERTISDIADDILQNGQTYPIVRYEGKILDGRNRYLACRKIGVEPSFADYAGDDPLGFVVSNNYHRRHLNESQRAHVCQEIYRRRKLVDPSVTLVEMAEQFNVGTRTAERAQRVANVSSPEVQKKIAAGELAVNRAEEALQAAQKRTGIKVTTKTPAVDRKKVQEVQEKLLNDELDLPKVPHRKTEAEEFNEKVLAGVFDGKRWKKDIREIQDILTAWERMPGLFSDAFELVETLQQENNLNMIIGMVIESIQKAKKMFIDPDTDSIEGTKNAIHHLRAVIDRALEFYEMDVKPIDKAEELAAFRKKYDDGCEMIVKQLENMRRKLYGKSMPTTDGRE